jgi:hypothetical protein
LKPACKLQLIRPIYIIPNTNSTFSRRHHQRPYLKG